ncbi:MAG: hypothetical protein U5J64_02700 [Halobacteriales archaeon]|nr:hypothetical protein [Halobacteriales archaeon]
MSTHRQHLNLRNLREELGNSEPEFSDSEIFSDATLKAIEKGEHDTQRAKDFELPSELEDVRLTERDGVEIREDCAVEGYSGDYVSLKIPDCIEAFRRWYIGYEDKYLTFENPENGDKKKVPCTNAYKPEYTECQYARFSDLERGLKEEYGARLHTALLSFTCSNTDDDGNLLPPVDHLLDLEESYDAVRRSLARVLDGYRWEAVAILEPHQSGYTHIHFGVFVDGKVTEKNFHPVIDAHLRNCPRAARAAHDYSSFDPSERPISVFHSGRTTNDRTPELENLSAYLSEYLGNYGKSPLDADATTQLFYTVMWSLNKQRIRPTNGAQQYMQLDEELVSSSDWELLGIMFEVDGAIFELNEDPGTISTVVIGAPSSRGNPPP